MSADSPVVLLRLDTEDPFTPQSDDATLFLANALAQRGIRATFPVTTWKAQALAARARTDVLSALSRHALGFHSTTHSRHPTIAEALEATADDAAVAAFGDREAAGARRLAEILDAPLCCYTQPGGNWAAEASPALDAWGIRVHHSEGWNAYVDLAGRPFYLCNILHFSAPVAAPKPFLSRLPAVLDEATRLVSEAMLPACEPRQLVHVVFHPTELVTLRFWDVVNFGGGVNRPEALWGPPPLRPAADVRAASAAFLQWLDGLVATGTRFWTAADLARAYPDLARGRVFTLDEALAVASLLAPGRLGSLAVNGVALSPAEGLDLILTALQTLEAGQVRAPLTLRPVQPPWEQPAADHWPARRLDGAALHQLVAQLNADLDRGQLRDKLQGDAGTLPLGTVAVGLALVLREYAATGRWPQRVSIPPQRLTTARHVKSEEALNWNWPVFAPGFRAPNLRRRAVASTWTLKPAEPAHADLLAPGSG